MCPRVREFSYVLSILVPHQERESLLWEGRIQIEEGGLALARHRGMLIAYGPADLGAFAIVLECIPATLACEITRALRIPTIGIGAGARCDGQILVLQDLLGMNMDFHPKFARPFLDGANSILDALARFDAAVKAGTFPAAEESYS